MGNPFKKIGRGIAAGARGGLKGLKVAYRIATRPEVMAILHIAGVAVPGLNAVAALKFLTLVKRAESFFPAKGSGKKKVLYVLEHANAMRDELERMGVPEQEWGQYLEAGVLLMQGQATLKSEADGSELLEPDLERLAELFEQ